MAPREELTYKLSFSIVLFVLVQVHRCIKQGQCSSFASSLTFELSLNMFVSYKIIAESIIWYLSILSIHIPHRSGGKQNITARIKSYIIWRVLVWFVFFFEYTLINEQIAFANVYKLGYHHCFSCSVIIITSLFYARLAIYIIL